MMHHHRLPALTERLTQQELLARPAQLPQLRLVQPGRLLTVHEYRHQASRAPLQSLPVLGRRSSWQRTSLLQLSLRAWEHRRNLPSRRSRDQGISPSTCAPLVPQQLRMLIERIRLLLEAWRAVPYFLNLNLLLTRKRGPLPQLPSVSKAPAEFAEA